LSAQKRRIAEEIQQNERKKCRLLDFGQSGKRYVPVDKTEDKKITDRLIQLASQQKRGQIITYPWMLQNKI